MDIYYCSFWFDFESSNNFLNNKCCCCCFETIETVRMHAWTASSQIILRRKTHTKILWMFYTGNSIMYKIVADSHQISLKIPQKYYRLYKIAFYRFICVSITMTCFSADFCYILRWSSTDLNSCWNQTRLRISHSQKKQRMNEQSKHINTKNGDNMQICPIHWHQHFVFWRRMPKSNWEKNIHAAIRRWMPFQLSGCWIIRLWVFSLVWILYREFKINYTKETCLSTLNKFIYCVFVIHMLFISCCHRIDALIRHFDGIQMDICGCIQWMMWINTTVIIITIRENTSVVVIKNTRNKGSERHMQFGARLSRDLSYTWGWLTCSRIINHFK